MDDYPLIENHGLIGDLQTAALVTTDGTIDWFCCPRFDSPSVFGALLDREKGGHFTVAPAHKTYATKQLYFPDTTVLVTRFMTEAGAGEVVDFMPVTGRTATPRHRLVRMLRCVRGSMSFDIEIAPRFDYGRKPHKLHITEHGAVFAAEGLELTVHPVREPEDERLVNSLKGEQDLHFSLTLQAGQERGLVMESSADGPPHEIRVTEFQELFDDTVRYWRS
jgi:GH15 family glucan-1,4-alpha-glucosidase